MLVNGFGAEVQNVFHSVYLLDEAGENHVKLSAPDTLVDNVSYTLPEDGLAGQVLSTDGLGSLSWIATLTNPMTTQGDLIVASTNGIPDRLAKGTDGQVLSVVNGNVGWGDLPVASDTEAGVVSTGTQTIAGDKSFTGLLTLNTIRIGTNEGATSGTYLKTVSSGVGTSCAAACLNINYACIMGFAISDKSQRLCSDTASTKRCLCFSDQL